MAQFTEQEVSRVLADLRRRWPASTEADALTILEDSERQIADEREFEVRDAAVIDAEFAFAAEVA